MTLICGFNLFKQFECGIEENNCIESLLSLQLKILHFSWSGVLFRQGDDVKYRGFIGEGTGETIIGNPTNNESIVKGRCASCDLLVISNDGSCWKYSLGGGTWNQLVLRESNSNLEQDTGRIIVDIAVSDKITLLLNNLGEVFSFPSLVSGPGLKGIQVACGLEHSVFLCDNGSVYTWGSSSRGQLGHGDIDDREEPVEVVALCGLNVVQIAAGGWHTCAITSTGDLYSWGWNRHGQIGVSRDCEGEVVSEPKLIELPSADMAVKYVSCGTSHTVILLEDLSVYGYGSNKWGQLGAKRYEDESTVGFKLIYKPKSGTCVESVLAAGWNTAVLLSP